jgi:hypothetical protein
MYFYTIILILAAMKKILFVCIYLFLALNISATHYMGGEISWECLPNGNYKFTLKLYRECYTSLGGNAATFGNTETLYTTVPGLFSITMTRVSLEDISPVCNADPAFQPKIFCPGMSSGAANMGAIQENVYTSDASYPNGITLNGVPPAAGWEFSHRTCCRNPCTNISGTNSMGWRLRAFMYSYNGINANPCYDNSPTYAEKPTMVNCTGYPAVFGVTAFDADNDSLVYEWSQVYSDGSQPILSYNAGYSHTSPLPGVAQNPNNIPAFLDSQTGVISYTSFTAGAFLYSVKISAYKCGQLVSETFKEAQIVLAECGLNQSPESDAPFADPVTGLFTLYSDTVNAGDLVAFSISGEDFDLMSDGVTSQIVSIYASGMQFGNNFTDPNTGCLNPPCATLNPPPPVSGFTFSSTNFSWQTQCNHLQYNSECGSYNTNYVFYFTIKDDYCPIPGVKQVAVSIVLTSESIDAPEIICANTLSDSTVEIHWLPPADPDSLFVSYIIYYSASPTGPFQAIDTLYNYNTTSYVDVNAQSTNAACYYMIRAGYGCDGVLLTPQSNVKGSIFLQYELIPIDYVRLQWNNPETPLAPYSILPYLIYKDDGYGFLSLYDSTIAQFYIEPVNSALPVKYQIVLRDNYDCNPESNFIQVVATGIIENENIFSLFPNPFTSEITLCNLPEGEKLSIQIYDMPGKLICYEDVADVTCHTLNLKDLDSGIYIIQVIANDVLLFKKKIVKVQN